MQAIEKRIYQKSRHYIENPSGKIADMVIIFTPLALIGTHRTDEYFSGPAALENTFLEQLEW